MMSPSVLNGPHETRFAALLAIRGRLALTVRTGLRWRGGHARALAAWFPDERIPRTDAARLRWLEDRIEAEYGPLITRYTERDPR